MKIKLWLSVAILALVGLLTVGCGATVPEEEYDQALADLATARAEVDRVRNEAQSAEEEAQRRAAEAEAQLVEKRSELEATQQQLANLQARVEEATIASEMLAVFVDLALSGQEVSSEDAMSAFLEISAMIQESEDEVLQEKLTALVLSQDMEQEGIDLVVYLLEKVAALSQE
jgi:hypothetical protein